MSIVIGYDGTRTPATTPPTLGAQLARATGETPIVVTVYPQENPIGAGRVDAEWVAYMREQAQRDQRRGEALPRRSTASRPSTASSGRARRRTGSTTSPRPSTRR